ncbi:hypothetical protein PUN28_019663 [Cardiocondyla obscurior]|uniref:Uncharacterized protein n=1 Tax=Cardiocondyla obscurior TaxID=286306 RepID=A0AAW2E9Z1_9HYME
MYIPRRPVCRNLIFPPFSFSHPLPLPPRVTLRYVTYASRCRRRKCHICSSVYCNKYCNKHGCIQKYHPRVLLGVRTTILSSCDYCAFWNWRRKRTHWRWRNIIRFREVMHNCKSLSSLTIFFLE